MALKVSHRAVVLEVGRLALSGSSTELAASEDVQRLYLGGHADHAEDDAPARPRRILSAWKG